MAVLQEYSDCLSIPGAVPARKALRLAVVLKQRGRWQRHPHIQGGPVSQGAVLADTCYQDGARKVHTW